MSQRFFGHPESPLFGVYHAARGNSKRTAGKQTSQGVCAALVCPPIGQEYIRTHWCLRLLGNQLARNGVNVLRMDYQGIGDSAESPEHINSLSDWTRNVEQGIENLKLESGAHSVMLIGQRLGGSLAATVARQRPDVNSVVLWEPVTNGQEYLNVLRSMHAQMLDLWVCKMDTQNDEEFEEILGSRYSRSLINEIEEMKIDVGAIIQPQLIIDVESNKKNYAHPEPSLQRVISEDNEGSWDDLRVLETARLRPKTSRTIAKTVGDMFNRLEKFGVLDQCEVTTSNLSGYGGKR